MSEQTTEDWVKAVKILLKGSFSVSLNMNDTFAFATSDAEEMAIDDFEKMVPVILKYGNDALNAYVAVKRKQDPIKCSCNYLNENFYAAKKEVEAIKASCEWFMELV